MFFVCLSSLKSLGEQDSGCVCEFFFFFGGGTSPS